MLYQIPEHLFVARRVEMVMHALWMNERGKKDTEAAVSVIRSLAEDILVVLVERNRSNVLTANGRQLQGQRVVAHNVADEGTAQSILPRRSFDRVFRGVAVRCAVRQSRGGARLRDGNSGQSGGYQELHGEWRMRSADELSIAHQNQEVWGSHRRPPTYLELLQVPTMVWRREASAKRSQEKPLQWYIDAVVALPCSSVEFTGHQVHLFVKHHCTHRKD